MKACITTSGDKLCQEVYKRIAVDLVSKNARYHENCYVTILIIRNCTGRTGNPGGRPVEEEISKKQILKIFHLQLFGTLMLCKFSLSKIHQKLTQFAKKVENSNFSV